MGDTKLSERLDWYHKVSGAPMDKDLADAARALEARRDLLVKQRDEVALYGARAFLAEREQRVALEQALEEARAELREEHADYLARAESHGMAYDKLETERDALKAKLTQVRAEAQDCADAIEAEHQRHIVTCTKLTRVTAEHDAALEECSNLRDSNDHEKARARLAALRECRAVASTYAVYNVTGGIIERQIQKLIDAEESKGSKP